jgi:hypothetical protein
VKDLGIRLILKKEAVPFLVAFGIAEFFYKFKSFALECLAFLVTWFVLSYLQSLATRWLWPSRSPDGRMHSDA